MVPKAAEKGCAAACRGDLMKKRYEVCVACGKEWNIARDQEIPKGGYLCPHCREKKKKKPARATGKCAR